MTKGREVPPIKTYPFTFPDTGIEVTIRKVSPHVVNEVQKASPPPKPPRQLVEFADGTKRYEVNESDPEYAQALQDWQVMIEDKARRIFIQRGVECEVDTAAVAELRSQMQDIGVELPDDDKLVYVTYICVGSEQDYLDLVDAITKRSQPTEAAVAEAAADLKS